MKEDTAFHRCTECLQSYKLINRAASSDDNACNKRKRVCHFSALLLRDLFMALVIVNLFIIALAFFTYSIDNSSKALISVFKLQHYPVLFYYLFGLSIGLCIVGVMYLCTYFRLCPNDSGHCMICSDTCFYGPFYYSTPEAGGAGTGLCGGHCCCESCSGCSGAECAACEMNEICVVAIIVVFVVFVLIGAFVCIVLGAMYLQKVVSEHAHVLHKFTLAKDYIVADLASDRVDDEFNGTNLDPEQLSLLGLRPDAATIDDATGLDRNRNSDMMQANSISRDDYDLFSRDNEDRDVTSLQSRFPSLNNPSRGYVPVEEDMDIELSLPQSSHNNNTSAATSYQGISDGRVYESKVSSSPTITKRF